MKKDLLLIGFWPDYESSFFRTAKIDGFKITVINPKEIMEKRMFFHYLPKPIRNMVYQSIILKTIKQNPQSIVLFQEFRLILEVLNRHKPRLKGGVMMRNVVDENGKIYHLIKSLQAFNYTFWSFDEADCKRYRFKHYKQFTSHLPFVNNVIRDMDFVFIGRNKGRKKWLLNFKKEAAKINFKILIDIRSNKKIGYANKEREGGTRTYENYLKTQLRGHCVLDIVQESQVGMTLRPLEALQYGQKLVTNNVKIRESDIFHPSNIYVVEEKLNIDDIQDFMSLPFAIIDKNILHSYSTSGVLEKIVENASEASKEENDNV